MTKRNKYNQGGLSASKSIGDLDLSLNVSAKGSGSSKNRFATAHTRATVSKGPLSISHEESRYTGKQGGRKFKGVGDRVNKIKYSKDGTNVSASYGKRNKGVSINKTFKSGLKLGASINKNKDTGNVSKHLSIFKTFK
jgi:hypothetical protein